MLEQSIARSRATLKRSKFQLLGIIPGFGLGLVVAAMVEGSSGDLYGRIFSEAGLSLWAAVASVLVLAGLAIGFSRSMRGTRAELERLTALRDVFQAEGSQSAGGPGAPAA